MLQSRQQDVRVVVLPVVPAPLVDDVDQRRHRRISGYGQRLGVAEVALDEGLAGFGFVPLIVRDRVRRRRQRLVAGELDELART